MPRMSHGRIGTPGPARAEASGSRTPSRTTRGAFDDNRGPVLLTVTRLDG